MKTEESNLIIADFMGWEVWGTEKKYREVPLFWFGHENFEAMCGTDMEFRESWDWLMPVIERVEEAVEKEIEGTQVAYYYLSLGEIRILFLDGSSLKIVPDKKLPRKERNYQCCVKFIKWYEANVRSENKPSGGLRNQKEEKIIETTTK